MILLLLAESQKCRIVIVDITFEWWKSYNGCQEIIIFTQVMILSTVYDSGKTHSSSLIMKDVLLDMVWYGFCF